MKALLIVVALLFSGCGPREVWIVCTAVTEYANSYDDAGRWYTDSTYYDGGRLTRQVQDMESGYIIHLYEYDTRGNLTKERTRAWFRNDDDTGSLPNGFDPGNNPTDR